MPKSNSSLPKIVKKNPWMIPYLTPKISGKQPEYMMGSKLKISGKKNKPKVELKIPLNSRSSPEDLRALSI